MTTEEALREAASFARSAASLYRYQGGDEEAQLEAEARAGVAAQISLAHSQLALAYVAEAQA